MAHLLRPRKGWENERLAAFLLSRFSFLAHPASFADDLGSDFFCTIFQLDNESGQESLSPRTSFAIQIKSTADAFGVDNKIDYLERLELPFMIGVVKQSPPEMAVYSAGLLLLLFSEHGKPERLWLVPHDSAAYSPDAYCEVAAPKALRLACPLITTFRTGDGRSDLDTKVATLLAVCSRTFANIATRPRDEHIYDVDGSGRFVIMAGPGSVKVFRDNFLQRLGEVFYNLEWILTVQPQAFRVEEFRVFESVFLQLCAQYDNGLPLYVSGPYSSLKARVDALSA